MREIEIKLKRDQFSLIWMSLHARENELLARIKKYGEDSDEGADALNDLAYLRLYKNSLKEKAEPVFHKNAFIINDDPYD
jgi:hypothetical protein